MITKNRQVLLQNGCLVGHFVQYRTSRTSVRRNGVKYTVAPILDLMNRFSSTAPFLNPSSSIASRTHRTALNMMSSANNYNSTTSTSTNTNTGSPPPTNPFLESYRAWADRTPFITRTTTIFVLVMYILSFFIQLDLYLANIPYYSIQYFEFYRIILSPFVGNSIIFLIIMLLSFPAVGFKMENSMGSGAFLFLILTIDAVINLLFVVICYFLYATGTNEALLWSCADFWTILFALISIDCFLVRFFCFYFDSLCQQFRRIRKRPVDYFVSHTISLPNTSLSLFMD